MYLGRPVTQRIMCAPRMMVGQRMAAATTPTASHVAMMLRGTTSVETTQPVPQHVHPRFATTTFSAMAESFDPQAADCQLAQVTRSVHCLEAPSVPTLVA